MNTEEPRRHYYCLLTILILVGMNSFGQCPHTVCVNGGFPTIGDFQWSGGGDQSIGECPTCIPFDHYWSFDLLDTGNVLVIHGNFFPPCDTIEIRVVSDCRFVYKDTCMVLPLTGSGCEFIMDIDPPANSQLLVYWRTSGTDSIGVIANEVNDGSPLDSVLYDMHLCSVLGTPSPDPGRHQAPEYYTTLEDFRQTMISGKRPTLVKKEDRVSGILYKRAIFNNYRNYK